MVALGCHVRRKKVETIILLNHIVSHHSVGIFFNSGGPLYNDSHSLDGKPGTLKKYSNYMVILVINGAAVGN